MRSYRISKGLAIFVAIAGAIVMAGWIFDIGILKSISPVWVPMKVTSAISFILGGIAVYFIAKSQQKSSSAALIILPITIMVILFLMVTYLLATFFNIPLGLEVLFLRSPDGTIMSMIPGGTPSVATMIGFILIAVAGVLTMFNLANLKVWLVFLGRIIMFIGGMAVIGYIFRTPTLSGYIKGVSTAMSFPSSILFVLIGLSLIFAGSKKQVKERICQ